MGLVPLINTERHPHRLRGRGRFVEKGRVRERKTGEIGDHRLEVEKRFQTTLGDLRLVGRVLGIPAGILQDVPLDDGRGDGRVVSEPDEGFRQAVPRGEGSELLKERVLRRRLRKVERLRG
jgi:hypothetical protein